MYTQCPECSTVFRITADALRAAQGMVRCGICSSSFNALDYLNEQPLVRLAGEVPGEDTITVEEMPGTEFIELSETPDERVAAEATEPEPAEAGEPPAQDAAGAGSSEDDIPDAALEFHGSPEDLERLFVAAAAPAGEADWDAPAAAGDEVSDRLDDLERAIGEIAAGDLSGIEVEETEITWSDADADSVEASDPGQIAQVLSFRRQPGTGPAAADGEATDDLERTDEYPVLAIDGSDAEAAGGTSPDGERGSTADDAPPLAAPLDTAGAADTAADDAPPILLIPEELRRGTRPADLADFGSPEPRSTSGSGRRWGYAAVAVVLALALAAQGVHYWRNDLVRNPAVGPWVLAIYSALGLHVAAPIDLSAFELRQLGTASEPGKAGRLKLRASLVNRAPFAQPFPLLRLTLQDRFGSTIATRDLEPGEYLPGGPRAASGLLGPSQRADAEVVFVDPGRDAVGFELDVCARTQAGVRCSADQAPRRS